MRRERGHEDLADQLGRGVGGAAAGGNAGSSTQEARIVRRLGVEEKAAAKGHRDLTRVCDLDEGTVEHSAEDHTQESLAGLQRCRGTVQADPEETVLYRH